MRLPAFAPLPRPLSSLAILLVVVVVALLLGPGAAGQGAPTVSSVAVTSNAGDDHTYAKDDHIQITVTFTEAVTVTGTPRLNIDMDPAEWGTKWANYTTGTGTTSLTFTHTVTEPNLSTQGIAVLANTLETNNGTIKSTTTHTDADLTHTGLDHNPKPQSQLATTAPNGADGVLRGRYLQRRRRPHLRQGRPHPNHRDLHRSSHRNRHTTAQHRHGPRRMGHQMWPTTPPAPAQPA